MRDEVFCFRCNAVTPHYPLYGATQRSQPGMLGLGECKVCKADRQRRLRSSPEYRERVDNYWKRRRREWSPIS